MLPFSKLLLIRHGATEPSVQGLYTGWDDVPLLDAGERQARRWEPVLKRVENKRAFSSDLQRAARTAALAGCAAATQTPLLREWNLGALEGQRSDQYRAAHPRWNLFTDGPPAGSGETPTAVRDRADRVVEKLRSVEETDVVAIFSHGQFLRLLTTRLLGLEESASGGLSFGPGRGAILLNRGGRLSLAGWNVRPGVSEGPQTFFEELK